MIQTVQASKGQKTDLLSSLANNLSNTSTSFSNVLNEIRSNNSASVDSNNFDRNKRVGNNFHQVKKIQHSRPTENHSTDIRGMKPKSNSPKVTKFKENNKETEVVQANANAMQQVEPERVNAKKTVDVSETEMENSNAEEKHAKMPNTNNGIEEVQTKKADTDSEANTEEAKVPAFMEVIELLKSVRNYQNSSTSEEASNVESNILAGSVDNNLLKLAGLLDSLKLTEAESEELGAILAEIENLPTDALASIKEIISKMSESGKVELAPLISENEVVDVDSDVDSDVDVDSDKSELVEALSVENNKSSNQILGNIDSDKSDVQNIVQKFIVFLGSIKALESVNSSENLVSNANSNILESISNKEIVEEATTSKESLRIENLESEDLKLASMMVDDSSSEVVLNSEGEKIVRNVLAFIEEIQVAMEDNEMPSDDGLQTISNSLSETKSLNKENISLSEKFISNPSFVKAEAVKEAADIVKNVVESLEESVEAMDLASEDIKEAESTEKYQAKAESKSAEVSTKAQAPITSEALKKDFKLSSVEVQDNRAERVQEADAKIVTVQGKDSSGLNSSLNNGSNNGANMQQASNNSQTNGATNSFNTENVIKTDFNSLLKASNEAQIKEAAVQKETQATYNLQSSRDIEKLTKLIQSSISKAEAVLKVRLTPENLGKLQIELTEQGGKISAKILADNENSHKLIMSQSELLKNQLAEKGIVIDSMEFAFNDAKSKEENAFAKSNRNGKQQRNGKDNKEDSEEVGTDIANNKSDRLYA